MNKETDEFQAERNRLIHLLLDMTADRNDLLALAVDAVREADVEPMIILPRKGKL